MDRDKVRELREKLQEVASAFLEADLKVKVQVGRATFNSTSVTFSVEIAEVNAEGVAETQSVSAFKALAPMYGLKAEDFGREFTFRGTKYALCGLNPKAPKFLFNAKRLSDGKVFRFPEREVKVGLGIPVEEQGHRFFRCPDR